MGYRFRGKAKEEAMEELYKKIKELEFEIQRLICKHAKEKKKLIAEYEVKLIEAKAKGNLR